MAGKASTPGATAVGSGTPGPDSQADLRRELEQRGVAAPVAERLAAELSGQSSKLTPEALRGALTGIALASAVHREQAQALRRSEQDLAEIERLMGSFASELKKVDEAVKILSTFVGRMREQSTRDPDRILH